LNASATALAAVAMAGSGALAADPIPLTPLTDIGAVEATATITVDGTVNGEPTQGDLTATLTNTDQSLSRIDVTGSLLGDVVAQVGGSAVKLFRPSQVSVYGVPEGTYIVVDGLFDLCLKAEDSEATAVLEQLSPQGMMDILTGSGVAQGTLVGDEDRDGVPVRHYVVDGEGFLAAAQSSSDPDVSRFARELTEATDGDLYVSVDDGYPVAYQGGFSGAFEPLQFEGDLSVAIEVAATDSAVEVALPGACDRAIPA
jgi:hypothetical protein